MEKMTFNITINAPRQTVWNVLWGHDTYPQWTLPFCEGSHAVTDWKKGSKVLFMDADKNGMVSKVAETIELEYMSFEHVGEVKQGIEDTESEQVKAWAGSHENYTLKTSGNQTELRVDLDSEGIPDDFKEYFANKWPLALDVLKELAEAKN